MLSEFTASKYLFDPLYTSMYTQVLFVGEEIFQHYILTLTQV